MARKDESLLNLLVRLPWWVSIITAVFAYFCFRFVLPSIPIADDFSRVFIHGASRAAAPISVLFLLAAGIVSAFSSWKKGRLLKRQTGLDSVGALTWQQFETLVGEVYRRKGYRVLENPADGPDGGVDLRLWKDGKKVYVQCKHWKTRNVGVKPVRELFSVMNAKKAYEGIVVTYGGFTAEAKSFARGKPLQLIDGEKLGRLIRDVQGGHYAEQPATNSQTEVKLCPNCESDMVLRQAKQGKYAGRKFWGCSSFPQCKGIKPYESE